MLTKTNEPVVQMRGIVKRFPGVVANARVDFDLQPGEIHTILGENGAGKTTLMKILYGLHAADEGEIRLRGKPVSFTSARDAIAQGMGMVHQHFMLVNPFSVADNIILGQPSSRKPLMDDPKLIHQRIRTLSEQYGLIVDPEVEVGKLSVGQQQRVEILKTLYRGAEILILDEPTAVLTPQEVADLLPILHRLTEEGKSIVFISHKLDEVLKVSERITVLRDGEVVGVTPASDVNKADLARMMVGRDVILKVAKEPAQPKEARLQLTDVWVDSDRGLPALRGLNIEVRAGEILGIAGVAGNGQSELEETIAGLRKVKSGQITICDHDTTRSTPRDVGRFGLAHVPSDRYKMGLLPDFSVAENMFLQRIGESPFTQRGVLDWKAIHQQAQGLINAFNVRGATVNTPAASLSGGNAQKMILARELDRKPQVLIAAQPTRGLDVSAIEYVHSQLVEQRDAGLAILLISTELDEILALSDRIAVMYEGEIMGIVDAADADIDDIGLMMTGSKPTNGQTRGTL